MVTPNPRPFTVGQAIFRPGDPVTHLHGVQRGGIRMVRYNDDGDEILIYRASAGETFAEAALFADVFSDTALAQRYCALLSRQVRDLRTMIEIRSIRSAPERILHYLRLHADTAGVCRLSGPVKDLAAQLGLAHETMYRGLKRLEDEGRIQRRGKTIRVERLEEG